MRRHPVFIAMAISVILAVVSMPHPLLAQEKYTDFRGRAYTADDLSRALFPAAEPEVLTRGFTPKASPSSQPPAKVAVTPNVFFEFNSPKIPRQYYTELDKLGQVLTMPQNSAYRVQIQGHTDNVGSDAYNQSLSEKRAESIKNYLVQHFGIVPERLMVKGYGKSQPRTTNDTQDGRDQNRRAELVNLGK